MTRRHLILQSLFHFQHFINDQSASRGRTSACVCTCVFLLCLCFIVFVVFIRSVFILPGCFIGFCAFICYCVFLFFSSSVFLRRNAPSFCLNCAAVTEKKATINGFEYPYREAKNYMFNYKSALLSFHTYNNFISWLWL